MPEITPGTVIQGRFRVLAVLGRGAMGVVYIAEQLDHGGEKLREVALKTIQPEMTNDPETAAEIEKRFLREVRITARLSSPNTVTVHDSGKMDDGQLFFSMELVRGETLKDLIRRERKLGVERAVGIARQICDALSEAHGQKERVIHRDLKPANIFVQQRDGHDWVKVADFGIAKILSEETSGLTATGFSPGTPLYKAPEQWRGKEIDHRADLYALGVILFEMLAGGPPFRGDPIDLMYKHLSEEPPLLPGDVSEEVQAAVRRLLAKDPKDRPQTAAEAKRAMNTAASGRPPNLPGSTVSQAPTEILPATDYSAAGPDASAPEVEAPRPRLQPTPLEAKLPPAPAGASRRLGLYAVGGIIAVIVALVVVAHILFYQQLAAERRAEIGSLLHGAEVKEKSGDFVGAKGKLDRALRIDPDSEPVKQALAALEKQLAEQQAQQAEVFDCDRGDAHACAKSCDKQVAQACSNLGLMYDNGRGVAKNNKQAVAFYRKGCDGGDAQGCKYLRGR